jgi:hypothetical protein
MFQLLKLVLPMLKQTTAIPFKTGIWTIGVNSLPEAEKQRYQLHHQVS